MNRPRSIALVATVLSLGIGIVSAGPLAANAGAVALYRVHQCNGYVGGGDASAARYGEEYTDFTEINACGQANRGLEILSLTSGIQGAIGTWSFDAPPGAYFREVSFTGCRESHNGWFGRFLGWHTEGGYTEFQGPSAGCGGYPHPNDRRGNFAQIQAQFFCGAGGGCPSGSLTAYVQMHSIALDLADVAPPTVTAAGQLLAGGARRGMQELAVAASDSGGGLANAYALVNGVAIGVHPFGCQADGGGTTTKLTPCPNVGSPTLALDTEAYPFHDGQNNVQACATDFANQSNPNLTCWPQTPAVVEVDNSCQPSPLSGANQLSAQFKDTSAGEIRVNSKNGATVAGSLADAEGKPVANATICVRERTMLPGAGAFDVATVKTDADGNFKYQVAPGPNREIILAHRYGSEQLEARLSFYSRVKPALRLSDQRVRNGRSIRLFGELPGPASSGRVVVFQAAAVNGKRWYTFRKAETDDNGRFKARYRFRNTTVTTAYRMRVVVADQNGYPYLAGRSAKQRVIVKG